MIKEKPTSYLEELLAQNQEQIQTKNKEIKDLESSSETLQTIIASRKKDAIIHKIETEGDFFRNHILPNIPHSPYCRHNSPNYIGYGDYYPGVDKDHDIFVVKCKACALEYILDNPWSGVDIKVDVDFDFTYC